MLNSLYHFNKHLDQLAQIDTNGKRGTTIYENRQFQLSCTFSLHMVYIFHKLFDTPKQIQTTLNAKLFARQTS